MYHWGPGSGDAGRARPIYLQKDNCGGESNRDGMGEACFSSTYPQVFSREDPTTFFLLLSSVFPHDPINQERRSVEFTVIFVIITTIIITINA